MEHGELVDLVVKVPAGLADEELEELGRAFAGAFPEMARAAEEDGRLVVVAHPGDPDECPDCWEETIGEEVYAVEPRDCPACREEGDA